VTACRDLIDRTGASATTGAGVFAADAHTHGVARAGCQCDHIVHHVGRFDAQHALPAIVGHVVESVARLSIHGFQITAMRDPSAGELDAALPVLIDDAQL
jgi:hypothetical protein